LGIISGLGSGDRASFGMGTINHPYFLNGKEQVCK